MVLEGIVTTANRDGLTNVSPMGPLVDSPDFVSFVLRPYQTSTTYQNLKRTSAGVLHITDDVELIARSAIGNIDKPILALDSTDVFHVLADACRWHKFEVTSLDDTTDRTTIACRIVESQRQRDFFGFCRAKHAVLEAAILATRTRFLDAEHIQAEMDRLKVTVEKTAGTAERRAFELLQSFIRQAFAEEETR